MGLQSITAEVRGKSSACCSLKGRSRGRSLGRRLRCQPLQQRLITLLHKLLALDLAVLGLEQPLLRALRPHAFRLLRLQLLHALLQAIDAGLALCALARKHLTLPFLRRGGLFGRSQLLHARLILLLHALLALEQAVLGLQQPLLCALCTWAFYLLRLQLLHALLEAVDAALPIRGLTRKRLALPVLHDLLLLLDALLALLRALFDLLLSWQPLAHRRRCARARRCGDMGCRSRCHRRTLRRRSNAWGGRARRRGDVGRWAWRRCRDVRGRARRHGRSRRRDRPCHCRRRGGASHGRRCGGTSHGGWCCVSRRRRSHSWMPSPYLCLGGRANGRRNHGDANKKSRKVSTTWKHDLQLPASPGHPRLLNVRAPESFATGSDQHCDLATQVIAIKPSCRA
ncbi:hypothetical protein [Bradyrhizobium neotropicale]|uniref:hypothetical protein n=1 Tax=Bradyrhizobium neotropicale TaxID=1497615 RepID=UPI001FEE2350|nr:hypothetical protein [Bradyrhizobium neotropicale]